MPNINSINSETLQFILLVVAVVGVIINTVKSIQKPDIKAAQEIALIKQNCGLKHANIDENISLIKNNHLKHIEESIKNLEINESRIFTILEERLPKK